jgi:alginate O-acetyltransferase complex protein AlgI
MIFNSVTFVVFLIITVVLFWTLKKHFRIWFIFLASLTFYGFWRWEFLSLVLISTVADYLIALELGKTSKSRKAKRRALLFTSLIVNIGLLVYFKYLYFIVDNINFLYAVTGSGQGISSIPEIILPLGISFYTFQTISYSVDAYRGHIIPEKNFALYGCYVTFFPQLVAGPILRANEVMDQLRIRPKFQLSYISEGLKRILYGFFLKVVLADNIAPLVDEAYAIPVSQLSALDVWSMAFLFGFQIYFDFAGYSHIAIGCANLMGIDFPENFNFPYAARSFKAFWKRWHISLSSWIRDYLYLPIAGAKVIDKNKRSKGGLDTSELKVEVSQRKKDTSLFTTWAIMGLWHGANWAFVFWGIFHALMVYFERKLRFIRNRVPFFSHPFIGWSVTIPLAMIAWIPFRTQSLNATFSMYQKLFYPKMYTFLSPKENIYLVTAMLFIGVTISYLLTEFLVPQTKKWAYLAAPFNVVKYAVIIILVFTFFRPINQFIYFQF